MPAQHAHPLAHVSSDGGSHVADPVLGAATGALTGIQLVGMTGLVAGLGGVIGGTEASLSLWSIVLAAVAAVVVARSTGALAAGGWLLLSLVLGVVLSEVLPLPRLVAPGLAVIIGSAVVLAATAVAVVARRDAPVDADGRPRRRLAPAVQAVAYGVPLVIIAGSVALTLLARS